MPTAFSLLPLFQFTYLFLVYPPACAMGQCRSNTGLQPSLCPVSWNFLCGWIFHSKLLTLYSRECFFLWMQSFVLNVLAKHWSLPLHQASVSALCQATASHFLWQCQAASLSWSQHCRHEQRWHPKFSLGVVSSVLGRPFVLTFLPGFFKARTILS